MTLYDSVKAIELEYDNMIKSIKSMGEKEKIIVEAAQEYARIVENIIEARTQCGLTQKELAQKCGIKKSAISNIESMKSLPRIDKILIINRYLNYHINPYKKD